MRFIIASLIGLIVVVAAEQAKADPYRWCAQYTGRGLGGSSNCYFMTLAQCQAAVSGVGGFCRPNQFYTGPDEQRPRRSKKKRAYN
jgi:hypothetical protein